MASFSGFDFNDLTTTADQPPPPSAPPTSEIRELQARLDFKSVTAFMQVGKFWGKYEEVLPSDKASATSGPTVSAATPSASATSALNASPATPTPVTPAMDPTKENRTCKGNLSKMHRLQCLHYIWTSSVSACAPNCLGGQHPTPLPASIQGPHFGCQLCLRAAQAKDPALRKPGNHWVDLLLEDNLERDSSPLTGLRACQIVFMAKDGTLIPAMEPIDSALIRALMSFRFKIKQRPDLDFRPALPGPSGVDASGFDYSKVPKGPGGGKLSKADKKKIVQEARNADRGGREKRGQPSGRGQPLGRGQQSTRGRGEARESSSTADVGLDYGEEALGASVAGIRSEEETRARRDKRERQKLEKERKKAAQEATKMRQKAEEGANRKQADEVSTKSREEAEEGEVMENDEETAKKLQEAEEGLDKMALE
ncbi:uncharacterized protein BDZ99DRAFT_521316 [Mytilinidion resinicola]|uniref:Uncharacterized protein n=1 Tax=Mytilinidion resinicola TaxID=574789 RepID=A0A6A6YJ78_9PEZI|nr:uncharacterized protein BDZ99DRAFT_521316 [Mytilinidion resinicola]KAF2808840.1 hypothetical protein BDZ99DRAFT_521316 [Mytilinidion resinicola]